MKISDISNDVIYENYEKIERITSRKRYPGTTAAFHQGWNAAIRFAKRVEQADYVCEHCGKLIIKDEDHNFDAGFNPFCKKCYGKLFSKGGDNA